MGKKAFLESAKVLIKQLKSDNGTISDLYKAKYIAGIMEIMYLEGINEGLKKADRLIK